MGFLNISGEAEIHTIPKICKKWIYIVREMFGQFLRELEVITQIIHGVWVM